MVNCDLQQLDDGRWWCPECDRGKQRLLPVPAQRKCEAHSEPATLEERIDFALANELATYPAEQIERNLAICRTNACDRFHESNNCLELWLGGDCRHLHDWFEALCGYERKQRWCERWGKRPE